VSQSTVHATPVYQHNLSPNKSGIHPGDLNYSFGCVCEFSLTFAVPLLITSPETGVCDLTKGKNQIKIQNKFTADLT
jgi:hypothetical protein